MTFTELQRSYLRAIRSVRRVYRRADTAGEKLERELDRLIKRKRLIQPDDVATAIRLFNSFAVSVSLISRAFIDARNFLQNPVKP